jgi:hypothetical protein
VRQPWTTLRSSRTLPGQRWARSSAHRSGDTTRKARLGSSSDRKCSTSS